MKLVHSLKNSKYIKETIQKSEFNDFLKLHTTVDGLNCWGVNRQRCYPPLKTKLKVIKNLHLQHQPQ